MPTFYSFDRAHAKLHPASLPAISRRLAIPTARSLADSRPYFVAVTGLPSPLHKCEEGFTRVCADLDLPCTTSAAVAWYSRRLAGCWDCHLPVKYPHFMHNQLPPVCSLLAVFFRPSDPVIQDDRQLKKQTRPAAGNIIGMMKHRYIPTSTTTNNDLALFLCVSPARGIAALLCVVARPIQLAVLAGTGCGNGL